MAVRGGREVDPAQREADAALVTLYADHYASLVRISAMLLRDRAAAEDVVQDAFVAMHGSWSRVRNQDNALAYLRQVVVNRSRSRLRHLAVVERKAPAPMPDWPSAEHSALVSLDRADVMTALRRLPQRQREAVVLRYYADLSEAQIAAAMGCSKGAVKSHTSRGVAALRTHLEPRS